MKILRPAIALNLFFILVCGLAFPAVVTGIAQTILPHQANGSLVTQNGKVVGSELIGQNFAKPEYFHPRPSAAGNGYDASNSSGTNLGPTSDKLINGVAADPKTKTDAFDGVKQLAQNYRKENGLAPDAILPADAVTRSASGLDPHISPRNAEIQAARVAKARNVDLEKVKALIAPTRTDGAFVGVFGDPAVNVLKLNRALDGAK